VRARAGPFKPTNCNTSDGSPGTGYLDRLITQYVRPGKAKIVFMGTALTIRDLVGERLIFRREQAVGLSPSAYLTAKIVVYSCIAALQTAVLTAIVVIGKGAPTCGAVVLGNPVFELYVTLAATAAVAAVTGLVLSAAARSHDQILPMLVITVMLSIVFSGGLIPVTRRVVLDQLSWLVPARWGFAASASTIDLGRVDPTVRVNDPMWSHDLRSWLLAMGLLCALGMVVAVVVRWRLRLAALCRQIRRVAREPELTGRPSGRGRLPRCRAPARRPGTAPRRHAR